MGDAKMNPRPPTFSEYVLYGAVAVIGLILAILIVQDRIHFLPID